MFYIHIHTPHTYTCVYIYIQTHYHMYTCIHTVYVKVFHTICYIMIQDLFLNKACHVAKISSRLNTWVSGEGANSFPRSPQVGHLATSRRHSLDILDLCWSSWNIITTNPPWYPHDIIELCDILWHYYWIISWTCESMGYIVVIPLIRTNQSVETTILVSISW